MNESTSKNNDSDVAQDDEPVCAGCPDSDQCRRVWSMPNRGPFTAGGLLLSSILAFLVPIFTAIIAGVAANHLKSDASGSGAWEIAAALLGLLVGVVIARLLMPLIKKHFSRPEKLAQD